MEQEKLNENLLNKLDEVSTKLTVLLSLLLRQLLDEKEFSADKKRRQGAGDLVHYFSNMGLDAKTISEVSGMPITSVRTLLTPKRRNR